MTEKKFDAEKPDYFVKYRRLNEIDPNEFPNAIKSLSLLDEDMFLRMQGTNLSVVDEFIMKLEYQILKEHFSEASRNIQTLIFLSAQSQMWLFAVYELLRTWRQRSNVIMKMHKDGSLKSNIARLKSDNNSSKTAIQRHLHLLGQALKDSALIDKIDRDLRRTHIVFYRLAFIRIILAKHELKGKRNSIARTPGYARINTYCGSLDYELESGNMSFGNISRRDIADEIRALNNEQSVPTVEELKEFDLYMKAMDPF